MNRRAWIRIAMVFALVFMVALGAFAQGKGNPKGRKLGLLFNLDGFLLDAENAKSGVVPGLGMKFWLADKMALRGVLDFSYASDSAAGTSATTFGLSAAFEYHLLKAKVSPYVGGLAEFQFTAPGNDFLFSLGGIFGAELAIIDYLGLFAEYNLRFTFDEPQFGLNLGIGNHAQIGLIIYLP
jgi:hypothetical protein